MSILNELYSGNICPAEKFVRKDGEYRKLLTRLAALTDEFSSMIGDRENAVFDEISDIQTKMEKISDRESFIDGFCIGARMMPELLSEDRIDRTVL